MIKLPNNRTYLTDGVKVLIQSGLVGQDLHILEGYGPSYGLTDESYAALKTQPAKVNGFDAQVVASQPYRDSEGPILVHFMVYPVMVEGAQAAEAVAAANRIVAQLGEEARAIWAAEEAKLKEELEQFRIAVEAVGGKLYYGSHQTPPSINFPAEEVGFVYRMTLHPRRGEARQEPPFWRTIKPRLGWVAAPEGLSTRRYSLKELNVFIDEVNAKRNSSSS